MTEDEARIWIASRWGEEAIRTLDRLASRLVIANEEQNLVARSSLEHVWTRHFADSAQLLYHVPRGTSAIMVDIGSGAGFPGLVFALLDSSKAVHLIEPRKNRVTWLRAIADEFQLTHCHVHDSKIERITPFAADVISARAVAALDKLVAWGAPFSTKQTKWLLPKGKGAWQELERASKNTREMFHVEHSLTDDDAGILVGKGQAKVKR